MFLNSWSSQELFQLQFKSMTNHIKREGLLIDYVKRPISKNKPTILT
jgi:hypothetical protein